MSIGLIGWRGDRLRSPGVIDSPISREGAFLANNVLFAVFAFVVLLGTVFPLIVEALRDQQISVGPPFFERMTLPLGLALLTLMAIAPVLPWRKASGELLRHRLLWPAWIGVGSLAAGRAARRPRRRARCSPSGSAGFAAGSALRQLVLATRRQGWRGLVGRANGGHDRAHRRDHHRRRLRRFGRLLAAGRVPGDARPDRRVRRPHVHVPRHP